MLLGRLGRSPELGRSPREQPPPRSAHVTLTVRCTKSDLFRTIALHKPIEIGENPAANG